MTARAATIDKALAGAEAVLEVAGEGLKGTGVPGLEGAISGVLAIIRLVKSSRDNSAACQAAAEEIAALGAILESFVANIGAQVELQRDGAAKRAFLARLGSSNGLIERIAELQRRLNDVLRSAKKLQKTSSFKAILYAKRNAETLQEMSGQLAQARQDFAMKGQFAIELILHKVVDDIAANSRAEAAQRAMAELERELERLPYAEASYRASVHARHGGLLAGTRVELLEKLDNWAEGSANKGSEQMPFFILSGSAGTGKSTIAFEVAKRAQEAGRLGATFFFMRGAQDLSTTELVFPTIARQLISHVPALQAVAPAIIREHLRHGLRQNLESQANGLFTALLATLPADHPPVVIVIDAIDECTEAAQDLVPRMLYLMMDALPSIPCRLRIFVSSRPELHIEDAFQSVTFTSKSQRFQLHEVPRPTIDADIRFYFQNALRQLPETSRQVLSVLYPSVEEELTDLAAGLFIFATTAMEYLKRFRHADIAAAMETLMQPLRKGAQSARGSFARLNNLYTVVLNTAFPDEFMALPGRPAHVKALLGCIAVLQDHVSPRTLAALVAMDLQAELLPVLEPLAAVVMFDAQNADAPIRPLHASFADFLVDAERCADARFHVDPAAQHGRFAEHCFALLARPFVLGRNICRLPDPAVPFADVKDRHVRVAAALPLHVQYACTYWPAHVAQGRIDLHMLTEFCTSRLLFWLEALSLLDRLHVVVTWFPVITHVCSAEWDSSQGKLVEEMLHDAYRLTVECAPALTACPEQLYRSALAVCPSASRLRKEFANVLGEPHSLRLTAGTIEHWPPWLRMLPTPSSGTKIDGVSRAVYAPHGRWVALCTSSGIIHLCSPDDGAIIKSIRVYPTPRPLHTVLISSNGLRILALDMRGEVRIISTRSGAVLHSLPFSSGPRSHELQPRNVAWGLSDREVLVLRSRDVLIWDPAKSKVDVLGSLSDGDLFAFTSLYSSSDGRWAILMSSNQDLQILDVSTRSRVLYAQVSSGRGVCFVPNSSTVIYEDSTSLVFFDAATNQITRQLPLHDSAQRFNLRASRDGSIMAYIRALSAVDGDLHGEVVFAEDGYSSQSAFKLGPCLTLDISPDDRQLLAVVPGSLEWKMYDISHAARLREGTYTISNPRDDVMCLALSPDSRFLGVLRYRNVKILAAKTGEVLFDLDFRVAGEEEFVSPVTGNFARTWGFMVFPPSPDSASQPAHGSDPAPAADFMDGPALLSLSVTRDTLTMIVAHGAMLQLHTLKLSGASRQADSNSPHVLSSRIASLASPSFDDSDERAVMAATISPDGTSLVADVSCRRRRHLFTWDVETLELRRVCAFRLPDSDSVTPVTRLLVTDADIYLDGRTIAEPNTEGFPVGVFSLPLSAESDDLVLATASGMPDEKYSLSKDGWISQTATGRKLLWLPPSRWPRDVFTETTSISSVRCGSIITTVSADNLLSVIDLSAYDD